MLGALNIINAHEGAEMDIMQNKKDTTSGRE